MFAVTQIKNKVTPFALRFALSSIAFFALANIKFYLPISPVPVTFHTLGILLLGSLLPFRWAIIPYAAYLLEGFMGSPLCGVPLSVGPSMGYFVGQCVALYLLDIFKNKMPMALSLTIASGAILFFGVLYLQSIVGLPTALKIGAYPFLIGDAFKVSLAYVLLKKVK